MAKKVPTKKQPPAKTTTTAKKAAQALKQASQKKMRQNQKTTAESARQGKEKPATTTRKKKVGKAVLGKDVVPATRGRPIELTMERAERICEAIRQGHFVTSAVQNEGLTRPTYYAWIEQGVSDQQDHLDTMYAQFSYMIKKAEFEAEDRNLRMVQGGDLGWQANAWLLERRFPARWGNRFKFSLDEAKDFIRKFLHVAAQHIPDREVLRKIVEDARRIEGEAYELAAAK